MINPAMYTKWTFNSKGKQVTYQVIGIWGIGAREHYQVVSYDLIPVDGGKLVNVEAEKMREWISKNIAQWS